MTDPLTDPVTSNDDGLDDRLTESLPAMIQDATRPIRDEARRTAIQTGWLAGVNWALNQMRDGVSPLDIGTVALNHYATLAPK